MARNLIAKMIYQAEKDGGTYAMFVVSDSGVAFTSDSRKRKSTKNFKLSGKEIDLCEKTLKALDERCLLFSLLSRIEFTLKDGRSAIFQKKETADGVLVISGRRVTEIIEKQSFWIISRSTDGAICFRIKNNNTRKRELVYTNGGIFDGAILKSENDLGFCVAGNIAGIRESLSRFIKDSLMNRINTRTMFSLLPSTLDSDTELNLALIDTERRVIGSGYPVFKNTVGTIVTINMIMLGTQDVVELFPQNLIDLIFHDGRFWIEQFEEGSREEYFVMDMGIPKIDREAFLGKIFDDFCLDELESVLSKQNDKWLRKFYLFCAEPIIEDDVRKLVYSGLKNIRCIRDSKGKMRFPHDVLVNQEKGTSLTNSDVIKNTLISPRDIDDEDSETLRSFFVDILGLGMFTRKTEMELIVTSLCSKKTQINRAYIEKLLRLADYDKSFPGEIDFSKYAIFPYESSRGIKRGKASEIVIGKPYISEGNLLVKAVGRNPLWPGMVKLADPAELERILDFVEICGGIGYPKVVRKNAHEHREFKEKLFAEGKHGRRDTDYDYVINGLDEILKMKSLKLCRLIWNCISNMDEDELKRCLYAEFSVNNREQVNRTDSSLVQILRRRAWIPDRNNRLHIPGDIKASDIGEDFRYDKKNPLMKAMMFGSRIKQKEEEQKLLYSLAVKNGMQLVSEEEYQQFIEWKNQKMDRR